MTRIIWRQLKPEELLELGDYWVNLDPNTPELQTGETYYNLIMQPICTQFFGLVLNESQYSVGRIWRPIGFDTDAIPDASPTNHERQIDPNL